MPKKSDDDWLPDDRDRFRRKVGFWKPDSGIVKEYPFAFGTNKDQAKPVWLVCGSYGPKW